eukprot:g3362.t1
MLLRGFLRSAKTDLAAVLAGLDGELANAEIERNVTFDDATQFGEDGSLAIPLTTEETGAASLEDQVSDQIAKRGISYSGTTKNAVLTLVDLRHLINPRSSFLGSLLSLPPYLQVELFENCPTIEIVLRIKAQALRNTIYAQMLRFFVFVGLVISEAYALKASAAQLLKGRHRRGQSGGGGGGGGGWLSFCSYRTGASCDGVDDWVWSIAATSLLMLANLGYTWVEFKSMFQTARHTKLAFHKAKSTIQERARSTSGMLGAELDKTSVSRLGRAWSSSSRAPSSPAGASSSSPPPFVLVHVKNDYWNAVDLSFITMVWLLPACQIVMLQQRAAAMVLAAGAGAGAADDEYGAYAVAAATSMDVLTLSRFCDAALAIGGWAIVFVGLRLLSFFRLTETTGPIIEMIVAILRDMVPFLIVLAVLIVSGAFALPLLVPSLDQTTLDSDSLTAGHGFVDPPRALVVLYMWLNGQNWELLSETISPDGHTGAAIFFFAYTFATSVVLLNLLIAIMGDTFQRVQDQQRVQQRIAMAELIRGIEHGMRPSSSSSSSGSGGSIDGGGGGGGGGGGCCACWWRCLPGFLQPMCQDDPALNPRYVIRVVRDDNTAAAGGGGMAGDSINSSSSSTTSSTLAGGGQQLEQLEQRLGSRLDKLDADYERLIALLGNGFDKG